MEGKKVNNSTTVNCRLNEIENKKNKLHSLQIVRFFAFMLVFCEHAGVLHTGKFGVSVFIILSGFLMLYNYAHNKFNFTKEIHACHEDF